MLTAREIVRQAGHLLLDFDGPVCALLDKTSDREIAKILLDELTGLGITWPQTLSDAHDPFEVLTYAAHVGSEAGDLIGRRFEQCEVDAVEGASATAGTPRLLKRAAEAGQCVTVVSNNSERAVRTYLEFSGLAPFVHGVSAREGAGVGQLKPSPFLLRQAMADVGSNADECVMIGDSASDVEAARAAGVKVIAFANKPGKRERFAALLPDALVDDLADL